MHWISHIFGHKHVGQTLGEIRSYTAFEFEVKNVFLHTNLRENRVLNISVGENLGIQKIFWWLTFN